MNVVEPTISELTYINKHTYNNKDISLDGDISRHLC